MSKRKKTQRIYSDKVPGFDLSHVPPEPKAGPKLLSMHGTTREDPYFHLREREDPEVLGYLEKENGYTRKTTLPLLPLQEKIFSEIKARIPDRDSSVPLRRGDYWYFHRYSPGREYPAYYRRGYRSSKEELLLDVNSLADGREYCSATALRVSPDGKYLAFGLDTEGDRIHTVKFINLETGQFLPGKIENTDGRIEWSSNGACVFYTRLEKASLRPCEIRRYEPETGRSARVYLEKDRTFDVSLRKTASKKYILLESESTLSTETRFIKSSEPRMKPAIFAERERGHEYFVEHAGGSKFRILSNKDARNFRMMTCPRGKTAFADWSVLLPEDPDFLIEDFDVFENCTAILLRGNCETRIKLIDMRGRTILEPAFREKVCTLSLGDNPDPRVGRLRVEMESMKLPPRVYDINMRTGRKTLRKELFAGNDFDSSNYVSERLRATAGDGERIPLSIVYRKEMRSYSGNPVLLYAYGSYGHSTDPLFSRALLSLLDRGFIFAVAHVRGGQEMGRRWYEAGRQLKKMNTFTDFISCSEFLIEKRLALKDALYAMGGSAGGMLVGAVSNMRPELFRGVIALVPFLDVVTTMCDPGIPLTTSEYDEWGDPGKEVFFRYMLKYSPYDNIREQQYPHILVTAALNDSNVQYWEPAKHVAKLRGLKKNKSIVLLKTEMRAGHGGRSGRYSAYRDTAFEYSFILGLENSAGFNTCK